MQALDGRGEMIVPPIFYAHDARRTLRGNFIALSSAWIFLFGA
jgi:hypothetical protein